MVKLARWNVQFCPSSALIEGHFGTTIIAQNKVLRVLRIYPQIMRIAVSHLNLTEGFAPIVGVLKPDIERVDSVNIRRV